MAGETSKYIGELGEDFAKSFVSNFGWTQLGDWNANFPCEDKDHKTESGKREKAEHGIDGVYGYEDPLTGDYKVVVVEAKAISWQKSSEDTEIKSASALGKQLDEFVNTLFEKLSCAIRSQKFREQYGLQNRSFKIDGLLVYYAKDQFDTSIMKDIRGKVTLPSSLIKSNIFLLANNELTDLNNIFSETERRSLELKTSTSTEFSYPSFDRKKSKVPWKSILSLEKIFSLFVLARYAKSPGQYEYDIFYRGSYSNEAIKRFCASLGRFQIYQNNPVTMIPVTAQDAVEDRHSISYIKDNQLIIEETEVTIAYRPLKYPVKLSLKVK